MISSNTPKLGTALITGASAGIGAIYADRLAQRGYDLILVARSLEKLQTVRDKIVAATGRAVRVVEADLTTNAGVASIEELIAADGDISLLVNNAGMGSVTPLLSSDIGVMVKMIDVNVTALTRLTYALVPKLVARGSGTIINIASAVALRPELLNGVYGATKAYVLALTQSLQHELSAKGLRVQAVLPAATATDFWTLAGSPGIPSHAMNAEAMVDAALSGLDQGEIVTIPPLHDGALWLDYEQRRLAMGPNFAQSQPAPRYTSGVAGD